MKRTRYTTAGGVRVLPTCGAAVNTVLCGRAAIGMIGGLLVCSQHTLVFAELTEFAEGRALRPKLTDLEAGQGKAKMRIPVVKTSLRDVAGGDAVVISGRYLHVDMLSWGAGSSEPTVVLADGAERIELPMKTLRYLERIAALSVQRR